MMKKYYFCKTNDIYLENISPMGKKTVRLTENQLIDLIEKVVLESNKAEKAGKPFTKGTSKKTGDEDQPFTNKSKKQPVKEAPRKKVVTLTENDLLNIVKRVKKAASQGR